MSTKNSITAPFYQVDVFSSHAYRGNPVAVTVLPSAETLSKEQMHRFASWTNLSETTFLLPPAADDTEADYHLRIFTPGRELPFAGHPTLGSCRAWLANGGKPKQRGVIVQRCGVGLVRIRISEDGQLLSFSAPPILRDGPVEKEEVEQACAAMGLPVSAVVQALWQDNGVPWRALYLRDAQAVLDVKLVDPAAGNAVEWGIVGKYADGKGPDGATYEVRTFAPGDGIPEDPVTGSFTAGLARYLKAEQKTKSPLEFIVAQGTQVGRLGRLHVLEDDEGTLWVGGHTVVCIQGNVVVP